MIICTCLPTNVVYACTLLRGLQFNINQNLLYCSSFECYRCRRNWGWWLHDTQVPRWPVLSSRVIYTRKPALTISTVECWRYYLCPTQWYHAIFLTETQQFLPENETMWKQHSLSWTKNIYKCSDKFWLKLHRNVLSLKQDTFDNNNDPIEL